MKRKKLSFQERIKLFESKSSCYDGYGIDEFLDDCDRMHRRGIYKGLVPNFTWHDNDENIKALFKDYLEEFEAWLKLQQ